MTDKDRPNSDPPDQDQQWLEILAGRKIQGIDEPTRKEAEALRTVILQRYKEELENNQATQDELSQTRELNRLLEHLVQEDLLEEPSPPPKIPFMRFRQYAAISVAAVLVMSLTQFMLAPPMEEQLLPHTSANFQEPPRLRSGMATQHIPVNNPRHSSETASQLIEQLTELNIPYRFTPKEDEYKPDWQLEIYITFEPPQNILTFLQQWRLKESENGWIRIVPEIAGKE